MKTLPELPSLQHADTDGARPLKRRRPALSCMECRKRKVKCDRDKPCGPCRRTRSPTCTYRPHPRDRYDGSPVTAAGAKQNENALPIRTEPCQASQFPTFDVGLAMKLYGGSIHDSPGSSLSSRSDDLRNQVLSLERELAALRNNESGSQGSTELPLRATVISENSSAQFAKSKFFGESHWNNCIEPYDSLGRSNILLNTVTNRTEINKASPLYLTVAECKRMARTLKATRKLHPAITSELQESVPSQDVCDQLVECYLRTFEGVFRVLHIPSFLRECDTYWNNVAAAKPSVLIKLLLVCAIGVPFYTGPEQPRLRVSCAKWVQAAESWLSAPHRKSRLNMAGIQNHVLLLLARQVCCIDGDLTWISAGSLLRSAMHLGLHRDPSHFSKVSSFHAEMRRRLWATVMEMTVQSSLDMGMPPMISPQDYDTQPPGNFNDEDIKDGNPIAEQRAVTELTQCSVQIAFYESLPLRLNITRMLNSIQAKPSHVETISLGNELLQTCRRKTTVFLSALATSASIAPNAFHIKVFDTLIRRFALSLHRPFFNRAKNQPKFYYSRKICLDIAVAIAAPASVLAPGEEDDWTRLCCRAVGFVKSFYLHSTSCIFLELLSQLEEQQDLALLSIAGTSPPRLPPHLELYRSILVDGRRKARQRLQNGEPNAKCYMWLSCAIARADALVANIESGPAVLDTARAAIIDVAEWIRTSYFEEHGKHIDLSQRRGPFAGREHGRGESTYDGVGAPKIVADNECGHVWDDDDTCGLHGSTDGNGDGAAQDMEWEKLMQDENLGFGWGFEGSPESWFGVGGAWGDSMQV